MIRVLVVDTETSGLHPDKGAGVVELAGVLMTDDPYQVKLLGDWQSLVNPGHHVPPEASAVHHLVDDDLVESPDLPTACDGMREALGPWDVVVAHNVKFDRAFLPLFHDRPWGCTLKASREWLESPSYSNQVLRYHLDLRPYIPPHCGEMAHRALYDCYCTAYLLQHLLKKVSIGQIVELTRRPVSSARTRASSGRTWTGRICTGW